MEFWIVLQLLLDFILVMLFIYLLRCLKTGVQRDASDNVITRVVKVIEPLLKDAETVAKQFELQLHEKKVIINELNKKLDGKIMDLNLCVNRINSVNKVGLETPAFDTGFPEKKKEKIFRLYRNGASIEKISKDLSISRSEISLMINLHKRLKTTSKNSFPKVG